MTRPAFTCPVPDHHSTCPLESPDASMNILWVETVGTGVVAHGAVTTTLLTAVRAAHPTRYATLDGNSLTIWPPAD
ncbi:hypothetical protein [Streptomyces termitum]|uniref:hypothetical protein n=1 Tax=Streptomyces termitum TaxID=67368 RepID=UPI0033A52380